jgi:hypothetical protein
LGKGMPLELFLMLIVDVLAEDIFEYSWIFKFSGLNLIKKNTYKFRPP